MKNADPKNIDSIVVIQLAPFGDVLLTTSYFETLKKHTNNAKITYVVKSPFQKIVQDHPFIDDLIIEERKTGKEYFKERLRTTGKIREIDPDLVIDQQNKLSTKLMAFFSKAKYKLGYKNSRFDFLYNLKAQRGPVVYSASRKFDILSPLGIKKGDYKLYYDVKDSSREYIEEWMKRLNLSEGNFITISPGSPVSKKMWNVNNYAKLADLLNKETDKKVVLVWGPKEYEEVKLIETKMETTPLIAPETDLNQLAALLEKTALLICNDGGVNHLSVTTETKTIAIFGPTEPKVWSPASEFKHHHHIYKNPKEGDDTFGINPVEVLEKVREVLNDE